MSSRSSSEPTVSLFPFLAVLVCAMGALILLLLAMTQKIRLQAIAKEQAAYAQQLADRAEAEDKRKSRTAAVVRRPAPSPPMPQVDPEIAAERERRLRAWVQRLARANAERDAKLQALKNRDGKLSDAEQRLRAGKLELQRLMARLQALADERNGFIETGKDLQKEHADLIRQIALTERSTDEFKDRLATAPSKFELVPYDGTSGTTRRPIFVECTGKGFRILPENEFLSVDGLGGFTGSFNPLLAGVEALLKYWSLQPGAKDEPEPYILLLVRPSGTMTYYTAREYLSQLDTPFGYELIEEDFPLSTPEPDPKAKLLVQGALRGTVAAREEVLSMLVGNRRRGRGTRGGSSYDRGSDSGQDGDGSGTGAGTGADGGGGSGGGTTSEFRPSGEWAREREGVAVRRGGFANGTGKPGGFGQPMGTGQPGGFGQPGGTGSGEGTSFAGGSARPEGIGGGGRRGGRGTGGFGPGDSNGGGTGDGDGDEAGDGTGGPGGIPGGLAGKSFGRNKLSGQGGKKPYASIGLRNDVEDEDQVATNDSGDRDSFGKSGGGASEPGRLPGAMGRDARGNGGRPGGNADEGEEPTSEALPQDDDDWRKDRPPAALERDPSGGGGSGSSSSSRQSGGGGGGPHSDDKEPSGPKFVRQRQGGGGGGAGGQRERTWNFDRGKATIGLEKKVEVHLYADRVLIGPNDATLKVERGETREELVNEVLEGIEKTTLHWGHAPNNFYWIPVVRFIVYPGGNANYERLVGSLREWGLGSTVEYTGAGDGQQDFDGEPQMSRRPKSEMEFGSDSFLDVLANIVGILIILIVIVGARLSRAPVPLMRDLQQGQSDSAGSAPAEEPEVAVEEPAAPPPPPEVLEPDEPSPEIADKLARVGKDIATLKGKALEREAALQLLLSQDEETRRRLLAQSKALDAQAAALSTTKVRVIKLQETLAKKREALQGVLAEFEQVKGAKPKTQQVRHQVTPISQTVAGEELHFRLSHNRVSVIPLSLLIHRLKGQFEKQKELMTKFRHHQGSIGPVDGYTLNYIVTRQSIAPADRSGQVVYRIGVSGWELQPEADEMGETLAEALRHGSAFQRALRNAPEKAALTFWVYPDSFAISRKLQSAAHAEGFIVSARPLPQGQPIAGSPNGTRSAGQ